MFRIYAISPVSYTHLDVYKRQALHKAFEDRKLNMVNQRREFFNVTLDEIKEVVKKNFDKTVEFVDVPDAEQYRVSMKMKSTRKQAS